MRGAIILAGGRSRRMKNNKALIRLGDKPLLLHVIEKVITLAQETIVVIGKYDKLETYDRLLPSSVVILNDAVEGKGPLAGMLTGMQNMHSEYALILPCDSPFIKREVLEYLLELAQGADAAIPRWPNGHIEPLHSVYKVSSAVRAAEIALEQDERLILDMIKRLHKVVYVGTDEIKNLDQNLNSFFNINTREDLITAKMLAKR